MASIFIVGAGFSLAANAQYASANQQIAIRYPLASDLGAECFGTFWNPAVGVEASFEAALQAGNREPITKLVKLIQAADYYLGSAEARDSDTVYGKLLLRFPGAQFISYNYDSLLEQILLQKGLWNPRDGFGVPVEIGSDSPQHESPSATLVIHLHGSVLLYPVGFSWQRTHYKNTLLMTSRAEPKFVFDPNNLGYCFNPFTRVPPKLGHRNPEERVIVPVPDKRKALRDNYTQPVFARARALLNTADLIIAIGYRFAECDYSSFEPLLRSISGEQVPLWVVAPDAAEVARRLRKLYPYLQVRPLPATFQGWAEADFALVETYP